MRQQYKSYDETLTFFYEAQKRYPDLVQIEVIGKTWEERDIIAVTISQNVKQSADKPALFFTGTVHAREWIGNELAVEFSRYVLEHMEYDSRVSTVFERSVIYLVPCVNPDGFEYSREHFSFWRKNRRKNADGTYGVDLNRNFSVGFKPNKNTNSNIYCGPSPFSEPETVALRDFVESHPNITIALDYHSQGNVFFPAHNFKHEDSIDTTDINVLCANMAEEIRKVTNRAYGIHQGKPPAGLIAGSGREYYYSKEILAAVVEVGSRNISDYQEHMLESIDEHIPALLYVLNDVPNYSKEIFLERVDEFMASSIGSKEVELKWNYLDDDADVHFEIYRSTIDKSFCQASNLIRVTKARSMIDGHLNSSTRYFYYIRAVCKKRRLRSAFAPKLELMTDVATDEMRNIIYPIKDEVGYVGEKTIKNSDHFGVNSLFVGVSEKKGECYGIVNFSLDLIPKNAIIKSVKLSLYPLNRVQVHIEKYGEWSIGIVDQDSYRDISDFDEIQAASILTYVGNSVKAQSLAQGIWRNWKFSENECHVLEEQLMFNKVSFRVEGPTRLPIDRSSQLMQYDIGYGKYGEGLEFRPRLEITFSIPPTKLEVLPTQIQTIAKDTKFFNKLSVGFDKNGQKKYGLLEYGLETLPSFDEIVIDNVLLSMRADTIKAREDTRFHVELIELLEGDIDYKKVLNRNRIERIGYDVSSEELKKERVQIFLFDRYAIDALVRSLSNNRNLMFAITATSSKNMASSELVKWVNHSKDNVPKLIISYTRKRHNPPKQVSSFDVVNDNGMLKLSWNNPDDEAFKGVLVVKKSFGVPSSPYDGQKLYGGRDNYTYDNFGALDEKKYFAVYSYDDVPNFSKPVTFLYEPPLKNS